MNSARPTHPADMSSGATEEDHTVAAMCEPVSNPGGSELSNPKYCTDDFRVYCFKVLRCRQRAAHDWSQCPFAHPTENARRRDPRIFKYCATVCPEYRQGICIRGDMCPFAHGIFECWLHPSRYRSRLCRDGTACKRPVCFFAHTPSELRNTGAASDGTLAPENAMAAAAKLGAYPTDLLLDKPNRVSPKTPLSVMNAHQALEQPAEVLAQRMHVNGPIAPRMSNAIARFLKPQMESGDPAAMLQLQQQLQHLRQARGAAQPDPAWQAHAQALGAATLQAPPRHWQWNALGHETEGGAQVLRTTPTMVPRTTPTREAAGVPAPANAMNPEMMHLLAAQLGNMFVDRHQPAQAAQMQPTCTELPQVMLDPIPTAPMPPFDLLDYHAMGMQGSSMGALYEFNPKMNHPNNP